MKTIALILMILLSSFIFFACKTQKKEAPKAAEVKVGAEKELAKTKTIKIKGNREVLLAEDIRTGIWCGPNAILAQPDYNYMVLIEVPSGKQTLIAPEKEIYRVACSHDGKWIVYKDIESERMDKGVRPVPKNPSAYDWNGFVLDLYRYEVSTKKHERFAVARAFGGGWDIFSPDGKKVFLAGKHNSQIEMPEPKWETYYSAVEWGARGGKWLADSSGVVSSGIDDSVFVEVFGKDGWSRRLIMRTKLEYPMYRHWVDKEQKLYLMEMIDANMSYEDDAWARLNRCGVKDGELHCESILEFMNPVTSFTFLPNNEPIFTEENQPCLRRRPIDGGESECVVPNEYDGKKFDKVEVIEASPDGRWLAYRRFNYESDKDPEIYDVPRKDYLFVIELQTIEEE